MAFSTEKVDSRLSSTRSTSFKKLKREFSLKWNNFANAGIDLVKPKAKRTIFDLGPKVKFNSKFRSNFLTLGTNGNASDLSQAKKKVQSE